MTSCAEAKLDEFLDPAKQTQDGINLTQRREGAETQARKNLVIVSRVTKATGLKRKPIVIPLCAVASWR
jgi:hypothetical protein